MRKKVLSINTNFVSIISRYGKQVEIEECYGSQEFHVENEQGINEALTDSDYYEFYSILLRKCYNSIPEISNQILTGKAINDNQVTIVCQCIARDAPFRQAINYCNPSEIIPDSIKAFDYLRSNFKQIERVLTPKIFKGEHHNKLQNSAVTDFNSLSTNNKIVFKLLIQFGLKEITFKEFHEDSTHPQGSIMVQKTDLCADGDLLIGWLFAELGFKYLVLLKFPKDIGKNLYTYLGRDFTYKNVNSLLDKMPVYPS